MTQPTLNGAENPGYIAINGGTQPPDTYFPDGAVGFTFWWYSSSAPGWEYKTMFDRWLAIPTPLPTPARVASPPPGAINTNANGRAVISFDYNMFCSAPGGDGQPRSSAWIKNCLASLGH
jgi:hypothetical protein